MVLPSSAILTTTIPMIVAGGTITKVTEATYKRNGKPVGSKHWHYKANKPFSHQHEGGHITHSHKNMKGYGRTRKSLKKW